MYRYLEHYSWGTEMLVFHGEFPLLGDHACVKNIYIKCHNKTSSFDLTVGGERLKSDKATMHVRSLPGWRISSVGSHSQETTTPESSNDSHDGVEESVWQRIQIEAIERHEKKWQHLVDDYEQAGENAETA